MHMSEAHTKNMNVNDQVSVTLTEEGLRLWDEYHDGYPALQARAREEGGLKTEVWKLMQVFGPHVRMGGPNHFVNNEIKIVE